MSWEWISCLSGAVTSKEAMKASSEFCEGISIPKPRSLAGSAISFLSMSFGGERPVRLGIKSDFKMTYLDTYSGLLKGAPRCGCPLLVIFTWVSLNMASASDSNSSLMTRQVLEAFTLYP